MPIYEFYCSRCHMLFNFFANTINTEKRPNCPRCRKTRLVRQMSTFASPKGLAEEDGMGMPDVDESKMMEAMNMLAGQAEGIDENDPRQAANLMRKLSDMTGLSLGPGMEEALRRMEAGEDPEQLESEMGDLLEEEDPFSPKKKSGRASRRRPPAVDSTLYDL
jgi:putative FmdB family regulatory protein